MSRKIDAHQHYWHPSRGDYDWMPLDNRTLNRPYHPADLEPLLAEQGIAASVVVQAAASLEETEYMLGIADSHSSVAAVVGWVNFEDPRQRLQMERLAQHPKLRGFRPMIQDIQDDHWMLREDIAWAFEAMTELGLRFDALGFPRHLEPFCELLTRYPDLPVVLDHGLKPQIRHHSPQSFALWAEGMQRLAEDTGAYCKLSGLVTECDGWSLEALAPYVAHLVKIFGAERLMWGSDWPVALLETSYADWHLAAQQLTADLSQPERDAIFGGTATRFYGL